jgi:predicted transcriptional regulator
MANKCYELKEYEYLSASGVKEAEDEIKELNSFRKSTVADMSSILEEKHILERKKQDRKDKSDMIKEMAAGDLQDADLIRMKKFLTVQVFLKSMLKSKMEKLKEFYSPYELAFLKIKGNTVHPSLCRASKMQAASNLSTTTSK